MTNGYIPGLTEPLGLRVETSADGIRTIRATGAIDLGNRDQLHKEFEAALAARPLAVVADLTGVGFCGSAGLEALVRLHRGGLERGVPVHVRPGPRLRRLMDMTGLTEILHLLDSSE
jgi:anti-sigma B factor antagonist